MKLAEVRFTGLPALQDIALTFVHDTRGGNGLHIVYGPNEAGKSTFLRALLDLWFGTAHASARYQPGARLEAVLERESERRTVARRLYRSQLVLRDGDILDDNILRDWLAGFDKDAYHLLWAFDHERLRTGSETLLEVKGDAGVSLFSAGGGVQHLQQVQAQLNQRLAELLDPRFRGNSVKALNKALRDWESAEQTLRRSALKPEEWRRLCAEIEQRNHQMAQHKEYQRKLTHEIERLQRIRRVRSLVEDLDRFDMELAHLQTAPEWMDDEAESVLTAFNEMERLTTDIRQQEERLQKVKTDLEQTPLDLGIWVEAASIDGLYERLGDYLRVRTQIIPELSKRLATQKVDIERDLAGIDPSLEWTTIDRIFVPAWVVDKARELARKRETVEHDLEHAREALEEAARDLRQSESELAAFPVTGSTEPLRTLLEEIHTLGDLDEQIAKQEREQDTLKQWMTELLHTQTLWSGPPEAFAMLPVPLAATVERYEREDQQLHEQIRLGNQKVEELTRRAQAVQADLVRLEQDGELPREEDLVAQRGVRDALWHEIRALWLGEPILEDRRTVADSFAITERQDAVSQRDVSTGPSAQPPGAMAMRYEKAVHRADDISDRLRRESQRVAARVQLRAELERLRQEQAVAREALAKLRIRQEAIQEKWQQEWQAANIHPQTPSEMKEWLREVHQRFMDAWHTMWKQRVEHDSLVQRRDELMQQLGSVLMEAGAPAQDTRAVSANGWMPLVYFAEQWLKQWDARLAKQEAAVAALNQARARFAEAERRAQAAETTGQQTDVEWQTVRTPYPHLPPALSLVREQIDRIRLLQEELTQWRRDERELQEQRKRVAAYEAEVKALAELFGEAVPAAETVEHRVRSWHHRLAEARQQHGRQEEMRHTIAELEKSLQDERAQLQVVTDRLEQARLRAECDSLITLCDMARQAEKRAKLQGDQQKLREQIVAVGDGLPLHTLREEIGSAPEDTRLAEILEQRFDELKKLEALLEDTQEELEQLKVKQRQIETGAPQGPIAAQQAEEAFARVDLLWNEWLRLYLARELLQRAIEEFRDRTEAHVLSDAGMALTTLTNGRYTAVDIDSDPDDTRAYLVAVRRDGTRCRPEALSDGTRDQVFLALRIAFMMRHCANTNPLPVVMDDVFIHFDDVRTEAALRTLCDLGEQTQVLYLTHHRAVVTAAEQLAQEGMPVVVHELPSPP